MYEEIHNEDIIQSIHIIWNELSHYYFILISNSTSFEFDIYCRIKYTNIFFTLFYVYII